MTFALWWALATLPGGLWPVLGASWQQGSSSLWFQSAPTPFGGRSQFSGSHKYWSLRYGSHSPGWGWSLSHKGRGLWLSPQGSLGAMWSGKGCFAKQPWTAQATVHSKSWVGRGSWGPLTLQRSLPGCNLASLRWDSRQIDALWAPGMKAVGFRLEGMEWRRSWTLGQTSDLLRYRLGETSLEWRSSAGKSRVQQQFSLRTAIKGRRIGLYVADQGSGARYAARLNVHLPNGVNWAAGWSGGQALVRWSLGGQSAFSGSSLELGNPIRARLEFRGAGISSEWSRTGTLQYASLSSRHTWTRKPPKLPPSQTEYDPAWIDLNYEFSGSPPELFLELKGSEVHRIQLLAQTRQWKDHIPPGTYAVSVKAPKGWILELSTDSLRVEAGKICALWVRLKRPEGMVRWVSASGGSAG